MKHCLVITAYKDIDSINQLINYTPKDWGIYIHIDKKSIIKESEVNSRAKVFKIQNINWGAWEHLYVFHFLLNQAFNDDSNYDYYHLITGQDFYATSPNSFDSILGDDKLSYISVNKIPWGNWKGWNWGFDIFQYHTLASYMNVHTGRFGKRLNKYFHEMQRILRFYRALPSYPIYGGSVYCSLHKDFVKYIFESNFANELLEYMRNTTLAEEIFFQTVLMNSPFKDKYCNNHLRYIDWNVPNPPKFLNKEDYDLIIQSNSLFCRKVDSDISRDLIDKLSSNKWL